MVGKSVDKKISNMKMHVPCLFVERYFQRNEGCLDCPMVRWNPVYSLLNMQQNQTDQSLQSQKKSVKEKEIMEKDVKYTMRDIAQI